MDLNEALRGLLSRAGASLTGFGDLTPLPPDLRYGLPRAVSIAVALDPGVVAGIAAGPTPEYHGEYRRVNGLLDALGRLAAAFLGGQGHSAAPLAPTTENYDRANLAAALPHKTAATRAGIGWIGKSALLVTDAHGPAVRLCTVLTDAPFPTGDPVETSRCGPCAACVAACPVGAPSGREWSARLPRQEFFDAFACERQARASSRAAGIDATICGICIASCPRTRRPPPGAAGNAERRA